VLDREALKYLQGWERGKGSVDDQSSPEKHFPKLGERGGCMEHGLGKILGPCRGVAPRGLGNPEQEHVRARVRESCPAVLSPEYGDEQCGGFDMPRCVPSKR
jgi:hypothetical protein